MIQIIGFALAEISNRYGFLGLCILGILLAILTPRQNENDELYALVVY